MTRKSTFEAVSYQQMHNLQVEAERMRAEAMADVVFAVTGGIAAVFSWIGQFGKRTAVAIARHREVERIHSELARMTDRDLADIGLRRDDIPAVAYGIYQREAEPKVVRLRPAPKAVRETADSMDRAA
jgi:uncharacterized protein YjiS (DUF1127 family)